MKVKGPVCAEERGSWWMGHVAEAWARAAYGLLPDTVATDGWETGADWQAAIR